DPDADRVEAALPAGAQRRAGGDQRNAPGQGLGRRRGSLRGRAAGAHLAAPKQDRTEPLEAGLHPDQARGRLPLHRQGDLSGRAGTHGAGRMSMLKTVALGLIVLAASLPVRIGAGLLFLVMAGVLVRRNLRHEEAEEESQIARQEPRHRRAAVTAFSVVFVAEWGDLTQLATAALQARYRDAVVVFSASTAALWAVSALAVALGNRLGALVPEVPLQWAAAAVMVAIALLLISGLLG